MQPLEPPDHAQRQWQSDREAHQLHRQLHDVDDDGGLEPARSEVRCGDHGADQTGHPFLEPDDCPEDRGHPEQLAGKNAHGPGPEQQRNRRAHAAVVAPLEEIADRLQIVLRGELPDPWSDPQRKHDRADRRGPHPPPCQGQC